MNHEYCNGHMHMIKKGDTLYALSRRYHVPLEVMLRANPYVDVYNLQPGDTVCIPGKKADGCNIDLIMPRMGNGQEEMTPDVQEISQRLPLMLTVPKKIRRDNPMK